MILLQVKPKPSLLPEVRPTDPVLGGGSLRGTGVGSTTGEGEEESAVPTSKRARATGNEVYTLLCTKAIGTITTGQCGAACFDNQKLPYSYS